MRRKSQKFQMRMHPDDHKRLMQLADQDRVSMAEWITEKIRDEAKRRKMK